MKIAIVHDWLVTYAGAERVLEQMINVYPEAEIFSLVNFLDSNEEKFIKNKHVHTSFIQKMPFAKSKYRLYLPLMMIAVEQFDLSKFDLIISSSHAVAKGVLTGPNQVHICMCYSPIRYAWDLQHQYLKESNLTNGIKSILARKLLHKVRIWDVRTSLNVDYFIAISSFISKRIKKTYRRKSTVIYPPVNTDEFFPSDIANDYYVTCSRMVPYKKIDLIVETFSKNFPNKKLIVIGDGPDFKKIQSLAGNNVSLVGKASFEDLKFYLSSAKAFIFAAEEDFGISPLEAQSCGTPVIAYGKGGALETVIGIENEKPTGVFFKKQTIDSLTTAVNDFEKNIGIIEPHNCRENALKFNEERFQVAFKSFVEKKYNKEVKT
jgi:glycosyltransferase involved in cell wall biosynthesis